MLKKKKNTAQNKTPYLKDVQDNGIEDLYQRKKKKNILKAIIRGAINPLFYIYNLVFNFMISWLAVFVQMWTFRIPPLHFILLYS